MKSALTVKWFAKAVSSITKLGPELRKGTELKNTQPWEVYKPFVDDIVRKWAQGLMDTANVNFEVKGAENIPENEPIIYTPNHSGIFDFPAIILNTPTVSSFISKIEVKKIPIVNKWMWLMDCVFIDRGNKRAAHSSLDEAIEFVKNGRSMVIFPEGTRSKTGELGEFKGGAMKIAMKTGAKIVPVLIENSRERFETTGNITPGTVKVTFLPPIVTEGLTREDFKPMPAQIRQMLIDERERQHKTAD